MACKAESNLAESSAETIGVVVGEEAGLSGGSVDDKISAFATQGMVDGVAGGGDPGTTEG